VTRALLLFTLALAACGPQFKTIELTVRNNPPVPVRISADEIELPLGIAVSVHAEIFSSTNLEYTDEDRVNLLSRDRAIVDVTPTSGERNFVFIAAALGDTCVAVEVNHEEEDCIPARVVAAP
jgi:hypothetical protein